MIFFSLLIPIEKSFAHCKMLDVADHVGQIPHYEHEPPGATPYSGLYGEALPERGAFFKLAVYKRVGKIAILVYERVTKIRYKVEEMVSKRSIKRVPHFGRNDYTTRSERLKTREICGDYRKFYCFGLSLRYKKGVQFCSRYIKGVPFGKN